MATAFFKLTNKFAIEETKGLSAAEIRILLFLKTLNPFGDRKLALSIESVAEKLDINRSTVSRAFKKLKELGKITIEVIRQVTISTPEVDNTSKTEVNNTRKSTEVAPRTQTDADSHTTVQNGTSVCETETADAKLHSKIPNCTKPTPKAVQSNKSGAFQTYQKFLDSLSDNARERFFNFVREKTKSFDPPLVSLADYLRSQSRYLEFYDEFQRVVPAEEINFELEQWTNKPEWQDILASIKRSGIAFIGIGGIDRKYENIPQLVRKQLVEAVRSNPELS